MRNPLVQSDLTLVQPNSSYLTKHVCFETWSLTLPSLFWRNLMKNKSQLFRHLNIPLKSIFREEFNGIFRFSIHSAKLELFHKTYISFFLFLQPKWFPKWTRRKLIFFNFSLQIENKHTFYPDFFNIYQWINENFQGNTF